MKQSGPMDCFPTCFQNAMRYFGVDVSDDLQKRLEVFRNGTQSCSILASEERIAEAYSKSINKLMTEWRWAHVNDYENKDEHIWAIQLINDGIEILIRNGPIEHKHLFLDSLAKGNVCICDINETGKKNDFSSCKHDILITRYLNGRLIAHDPKARDPYLQYQNESFMYVSNKDGTNLEIDCDYFFSNDDNYMKPCLNEFQQDHGYKFMIISRLEERKEGGKVSNHKH